MKSIMRTRIIWGLLGVLAGVWITNIGVVLTIRNSVVREYRSPQDLTTTLQTLTSNAQAHGWTVSQPVAFEYAVGTPDSTVPVRIVELTSPAYANNLVAYGRNRSVAMAPTTLVLYQQKGQVYVASLNTGLIGRFFRIESSGPMDKKRADEREIMGFLARR